MGTNTEGATTPQLERSTVWALGAVIVLGCALRLTGLGVHSLWFDEGGTLLVAQSDEPFEVLRRDHHMPLSFLAFRVWLNWFGESDVALRTLPALISCGALVLFAWLAGSWLDAGERVMAVALWAVSPFHVWHGQEVRMYPFLEAATLIALGGIALYLRGRRASGLALVVLGHALSLGSHYMGVLLFAGTLTMAALAWWKRALTLRAALELCVAAGVGFLVWVPWFVTSLGRQLNSGWGFTVKDSPLDLLELPVRQIVVEPAVLPHEWWFAGYLLGAVLLAGMACFLWTALRRPTLAKLCMALCFFAPTGGALLVLEFTATGFQPKYLMNAAAGGTLMIGAGLATLPNKWLRRSACAYALLGCLAITLLHKRANLREDYRGACADTVASWQANDWLASISSTPDEFSQITVRHYLRDRPDILGRLIGNEEFEAKLMGELRPGERMHVIFRDADYAKAWEPAMERRWQLIQRDPMRFRLEHSLWSVPASALKPR